MEMLKNKAKSYLVPVYQSPQESCGNSVIQGRTIVVRQAIKDDLTNSGLRVRVVIRMKLAG
jgi:hypothetical protein